MRYRALLVAVLLVLSAAICGLSTEEELTNDSRKTAVAVRITFMTRVMITGHGREFSNQDPASGLSDVFVFSGGEVRRNGTFEVNWSPGLAIKSVEWLSEYEDTEDDSEATDDCGCTDTLPPDASTEGSHPSKLWLFLMYSSSQDDVICLLPGTHYLSALTTIDEGSHVTIRGCGENPSSVVLSHKEYDDASLGITGGSLTIENLTLDIEMIFVMNAATCSIRDVATSGVHFSASKHATVDIHNSVISNGYFRMSQGSTLVLVESGIFPRDNKDPIDLSESATLDMRNSTIHPGASTSIRVSDNVAVSVTGSGNQVSGVLDPSYPWPTGFVTD